MGTIVISTVEVREHSKRSFRSLLYQTTGATSHPLCQKQGGRSKKKEKLEQNFYICKAVDSLMEGLVNTQIARVGAHCRQPSSLLLPALPLRFKRNWNICQIGMNKSPKSLKSIAASVQRLDSSKLDHFNNTLPSKDVLELWRNANAVCFDVDSTVILDEGIDELAEFCGAGKAVAEWTSRAMNGSVPFEEALAARLSLFNPSFAQVQDFLAKRPPRLSPGIEELVNKLKAKNTTVYLVSGGFRQMINPVASILGVPTENIFANQLLFASSGEFLGFDTKEPTSRSGGKATAVQQIRKAQGCKSLVMIGDGATDLEARKPGGADIYICYAGVQLREAVAAKADWLVFAFKDLINSLE